MSQRIVTIAAMYIACASSLAAAEVPDVADKIDAFLEQHWKATGIEPAAPADDATFLRRATLDLAGRIPTPRELDQYLADKAADKRQRLVRRLVDSPEFPLHFGVVLDQMIQGEQAGNEAFIDYLRRSLRDGKPWDQMFRELMVGPWDTEASKPANRFLDKRAKATDALTSDTTRVFFGVDITCAKCHDHPLVEQWSQDHFYGMLSFFYRTTGGKGTIGEKNDGDVKFVRADGQEKTARPMFLSGLVVTEPEKTTDGKQPAISRREQLVRVALADKHYFSRSAVNRIWEYFFGRGLVHPVDQMHTENRSTVPAVLEWLAEDFAANGYDLKRLIASVATTRAYALSSRGANGAKPTDESFFAIFRLRPLMPQQYVMSLLVALGDGSLDNVSPLATRVERYVGVDGLPRIEAWLALEEAARPIAPAIEPRTVNFRPGAREALFLSNNEALQQVLWSRGEGLFARLSGLSDSRQIANAAMQATLMRSPNDDELARMSELLDQQDDDRKAACKLLMWALITSAEFRFNH